MKLALGTVQFGLDYGVANNIGKVTFRGAEKILGLAKANGINTLDTAISYGESEANLGKLNVEDFDVVTKLPPLPNDQRNIFEWVIEQVNNSLKRLKLKRIYGLLLHRSQDLLSVDGPIIIKAIKYLKARGTIQKIGISIYRPEELELIKNKIKLDLVQAPLNVIDRRFQMSGWLDLCKNDGVEIHIRSVFLQGLLLMDKEKRPRKFDRWGNILDRWMYELHKSNLSPLVASLSYVRSVKQIDRVIVGVDNELHLLEIISAFKSTEIPFDNSFMISNDVDLIEPSRWTDL